MGESESRWVKMRDDINKKAAYALTIVIFSASLFVSRLYSYLLFHSMAELISIVIAASIFVIAWNTRKFMPNVYLLFIGIAYLNIAFLDLVHTLAYKGMGVFPEADANLPTQVWIAGRYMEAVSLFVAPCYLGKKLRIVPIITAYFFTTVLLLISIHFGVFPDCFIEGSGLTSFKVASEYFISLILIAGIINLRKRREYFESSVLNLLIWSIIITIASEMAFTLYADVYDFFNMLGHYFKVISFYLIYEALIQTNLKKPYRSLVREIDERKKAEANLVESEERLRLALAGADLGTWDWDVVSGTVTFDERWAKMLGYNLDEIEPHLRAWERLVHPDDMPHVMEALTAHLEGKTNDYKTEHRMLHKSGKWIWILDSGRVIERNAQGKALRACGTHLDITERKRAEKEKDKLEAQLRQAQKMESIGRLAGGVAHDYNNALSVIIGFTELTIDDVDPTGPLRANLEEVLAAANRAKDITRQLLAFARKQTIAPKVLDLNNNVEGMLGMLRRLIGEDIDLAWLPGASLWPVKMDPSQIDQILANLCVNARDAIGGVGKVTIETHRVVIDADYCADHVGFVPGEFVELAVSDNGCGMDKEILSDIFEPFFTTKGPEKGTGLGLATVYGIVKQNNGFINVYSEPGKGTTIKIYLPRHEGKTVETQGETETGIPLGRGETVLLVEDDLSILELARKILDGLGYTVLIAGTPGEALHLAEEHAGEIHLLVTDVIMPEMNGRELAGRLQSLCPGLKYMFMSGYTANAIAHRSVLEKGVHFIQKPFSKRDLAKNVRKALDENKS
jgi:PAS domain S-box-containing protein